ncbi:MAG: hypothetical protein ACI3YC_03485 [Alloprevotella sp.]
MFSSFWIILRLRGAKIGVKIQNRITRIVVLLTISSEMTRKRFCQEANEGERGKEADG